MNGNLKGGENMVQVVQQTREQKIKMYMSLPKSKLAELLYNCNEETGKVSPCCLAYEKKCRDEESTARRQMELDP